MNYRILIVVIFVAVSPPKAPAASDSCVTGGPCGIEAIGTIDIAFFSEPLEGIADGDEFIATLSWESMEAVELSPDPRIHEYFTEDGEVTLEVGQSSFVYSNLNVILETRFGGTALLIDFYGGDAMGSFDLSNDNVLVSKELGDVLATIDGTDYSQIVPRFVVGYMSKDPNELELSGVGYVTSTRLVPESNGSLATMLAVCLVLLRRSVCLSKNVLR